MNSNNNTTGSLGCLDMKFASKDIIHVASSIYPILSTLSNTTSASLASSNSNNNATRNKLETCMKQGIISFASDELTPFARLITHNLLIKNHNDYTSTNANTWNAFESWDDTPVVHACPDIINNNKTHSLIIDITLPKDYWKFPTQINMQTCDECIITLQRYIEEIF